MSGSFKKQVQHFVILQGIRQSIKGVPIGLIAGQIITWCACLLLKYISLDRFSEIPLFQFSWIGLIAGAIIGFLIVLLASLAPAKKRPECRLLRQLAEIWNLRIKELQTQNFSM